MENVPLSLVPRELRFYELFQQQGNVVSRTLDELSRSLGEGLSRHSVLRDLEHEGDEITHELYNLTNRTFTTPIDRDDILTLAHSLDEVVDLAEEVADRLDLYKVGSITGAAKELGECLAKAGREVAQAVTSLDDLKKVGPVLQEIHRLENEGDAITRRALSRLFDENHREAANLIKWKDIYALLESTLDECEEVAEIIETIAIKHA